MVELINHCPDSLLGRLIATYEDWWGVECVMSRPLRRDVGEHSNYVLFKDGDGRFMICVAGTDDNDFPVLREYCMWFDDVEELMTYLRVCDIDFRYLTNLRINDVMNAGDEFEYPEPAEMITEPAKSCM